MFFIFSKTAGFLAHPSNALILLALLGLVLAATRFRRAGLWLMGTGIVLLAIGGWSPAANLLILPLEQRFPPWDASRGPPDGIIVLGGAISPEVSADRGEPQLNEAAERLAAMVLLARRYPDARLVFSGGSSALVFKGVLEADHAILLLERLGVPRERVTLERRSRNTAENAAAPRRWCSPNPASVGCW